MGKWIATRKAGAKTVRVWDVTETKRLVGRIKVEYLRDVLAYQHMKELLDEVRRVVAEVSIHHTKFKHELLRDLVEKINRTLPNESNPPCP